MKRSWLALMIGVVLGAGCGDDGDEAVPPCAGDHVGVWRAGEDSITLREDCAIEIAQAPCTATGTYAGLPAEGRGAILVEITDVVGGPICTPVGSYACGYERTGNALTTDCGFGRFSWTRE